MLNVRVIVVAWSLSHVWLFATPWTAACQVSLSITNPWSLLKLMSIESVMPSNHLILCPLLLLQSFPASGSFPMSQPLASGGQEMVLELGTPPLGTSAIWNTDTNPSSCFMYQDQMMSCMLQEFIGTSGLFCTETCSPVAQTSSCPLSDTLPGISESTG